MTVVERTGTGLDYLQRIVDGEIPGVPIGDTLGFRLVEVVGRPDPRSYNLIGSVHGRWAAGSPIPKRSSWTPTASWSATARGPA